MKFDWRQLALGGLIVLLVYLLFSKVVCNGPRSDNQQAELINSLNDSLVIYKHKDSSSTATISVLRTEKANVFTSLNIRDKEVKRLQEIVKEYSNQLKEGSSVTNALIETLAKTQGKTTIVYKDTGTHSTTYLYPEYQYSDSTNKWITYTQRMNKDSSYLDLKVNNEFSAVVGMDKRKPFVDLTLYNPYSAVKSLRTYQVSLPPPKKFGFGFNAGMGFSNGLTPKPYIGVGLSYNIIRF